MNISKCPYCKKRSNDEAVKVKIVKLCAKNKLVSEIVDAGGRELTFPFGKVVRVHDMCYHCDYKTLLKHFPELT